VIKNLANAVGRRKTSVARVYIREGKGDIIVNGKTLSDFFPIEEHQDIVKRPLKVTEMEGKCNILINVKGGGITGQAGAILHGLSRALLEIDENHRTVLKANGYLTRDSRMVERKKYGQPGARKKFQFSKR
jgi:small subunit ribosomal protein S9